MSPAIQSARSQRSSKSSQLSLTLRKLSVLNMFSSKSKDNNSNPDRMIIPMINVGGGGVGVGGGPNPTVPPDNVINISTPVGTYNSGFIVGILYSNEFEYAIFVE